MKKTLIHNDDLYDYCKDKIKKHQLISFNVVYSDESSCGTVIEFNKGYVTIKNDNKNCLETKYLCKICVLYMPYEDEKIFCIM
jgi:hypothetical protein